jgi:hypothetical protein
MDRNAPTTDKIALFRSLFRGRDDVYPRRYENQRSGRVGYAPACGNEWVRGICEKPRIKCADCAHRAFLAVTEEVIRWHLSGKDNQGKDFTAGVYPMLADETCCFLAIDFDKETWREDVRAVMQTCRRLEIPAALERSRSGNGGHVWLFFSEAVPATLARKVGSHILTETMEHRPGLGLASYDRMFPNHRPSQSKEVGGVKEEHLRGRKGPRKDLGGRSHQAPHRRPVSQDVIFGHPAEVKLAS